MREESYTGFRWVDFIFREGWFLQAQVPFLTAVTERYRDANSACLL